MYSLRQATEADFDFLYDLHKATMQEYVEAIWGWNEEWQQEYFARKWDPTKRLIIRVDGADAGVLVVEQRADEYYLALIELLPEYQGRGVGTAVVTDHLLEAQRLGLSATLHVLKTDIRARQLYQRLGFTIVAEEEIRYKMATGIVPVNN